MHEVHTYIESVGNLRGEKRNPAPAVPQGSLRERWGGVSLFPPQISPRTLCRVHEVGIGARKDVFCVLFVLPLSFKIPIFAKYTVHHVRQCQSTLN